MDVHERRLRLRPVHEAGIVLSERDGEEHLHATHGVDATPVEEVSGEVDLDGDEEDERVRGQFHRDDVHDQHGGRLFDAYLQPR